MFPGLRTVHWVIAEMMACFSALKPFRVVAMVVLSMSTGTIAVRDGVGVFPGVVLVLAGVAAAAVCCSAGALRHPLAQCILTRCPG